MASFRLSMDTANLLEKMPPLRRARAGIRMRGDACGGGGTSGGGLDDLFALLPVAGAEFVRLQSIQHAQHFLRIAPDAHVGDIGEADDAFRIDQESRALGDASLFVKDGERLGEA